MLLVVLVAVAGVVTVLTLWGMYRLRRGVLLRLIAGLSRRNIPLEPALSAVADRREEAGVGTRLAGRLAFLLQRGWSLPAAMREVRLITPGEVVALQAGLETGTAAGLLDGIAERTSQFDRRLLRVVPFIMYPLGLGLMLLSVTGFLYVFIVPKYLAMFREMGLAAPWEVDLLLDWGRYGLWPIAGLFLWGSLLMTVAVYPLGVRLWWQFPIVGHHFRIREQARLARNLGFLLRAGITLERAVEITHVAAAGGRFARQLGHVSEALDCGVPVSKAFVDAGRWRSELLWAIEAAGQGAPPAQTFETVSQVLEARAEASLDSLLRAGTPLMVLLASISVGSLSYAFFGILVSLERSLL